jgi:hypothetical protein
MSDPMYGGTAAPPPPALPAKASGKATTALILGILGILCCSIVAPVASCGAGGRASSSSSLCLRSRLRRRRSRS